MVQQISVAELASHEIENQFEVASQVVQLPDYANRRACVNIAAVHSIYMCERRLGPALRE